MSLEVLIQDALQSIDETHAEILSELTGGVSVEERDTWAAKEQAAQAITDGNATEVQTQMIGTEAQIVGEDVNTLVAKVLGQAAAFKLLIGIASGIRRKGRTAVKTAQTEIELRQILGQIEVEAAQAVAQAKAQMGG